MKLIVNPSNLNGKIEIPASKSHTIRAVVIATLANGKSEIINPLDSGDTQSAIRTCAALGAKIVISKDKWIIHGTNGKLHAPDNIIDVGNSGTTLYFALNMAALLPAKDGYAVFTGDSQIRHRTAQPLIEALNTLGADAFSTRLNGMSPIVVKGKIKGGIVHIDGSKTSQYISSLLLSCPLAQSHTEIYAYNPIEKPYIQMTLDWLKQQAIEYSYEENMEYFYIKGRQSYSNYKKRIPGDFSSATFFLAAANITDSDIVINGLDMNDSQGDKAVVLMLKEMGAIVEWGDQMVRIKRDNIMGTEFDMNAIPDALPAMAVVGCFAKGVTKLVNVSQARLKETDRIKVMCQELSKMGAKIKELPDGLVIEESKLIGANVNGHNDHRVVMALAVAGLSAAGKTVIDTAEAIGVTFPNFVELMTTAGAKMELKED